MTTNKPKIHAHLKSFIHSVVIAEMCGHDSVKSSRWKENLMRQVQGSVLDRLGEIKQQSDLERITTEEVGKVQMEFVRTLEMVGKVLQQVPVDVLRQNPSVR